MFSSSSSVSTSVSSESSGSAESTESTGRVIKSNKDSVSSSADTEDEERVQLAGRKLNPHLGYDWVNPKITSMEVEIETIQPVTLETIEADNSQNVMGPSKGKKKGHKSGKRSHSSSKRHRYMVGSSSRVLPETVFTTTTHFSNFVQANMNEPPCDMLKTSNIPSLADSIVELASRAFLIGKVIKEESANGISAAEFERLKKELTESGKNLELALEARSSLTGQVKELSNINIRNEAEIKSLKAEIASLTAERLKLVDKNDHLEKSIFELSSTKNANAEKMHHLEEEISQLKRSVSKAERFVVDQHKLGFSKALQQAKYFYEIPLDEGNFDVGKDLYNNELIPIEDIPRQKTTPNVVMNEE